MVRPKNNMLRKKLYRDMSRAAMQFLSIIALCALGTFAFSASGRHGAHDPHDAQHLLRGKQPRRFLDHTPHRRPFRAGEGCRAAGCEGGLRARLNRSGYDASGRRFRFRHGLRRRNDHQQTAASRGRAAGSQRPARLSRRRALRAVERAFAGRQADGEAQRSAVSVHHPRHCQSARNTSSSPTAWPPTRINTASSSSMPAPFRNCR